MPELSPFDYTKSIDTRAYIADLSGYNAKIVNKQLSFWAETLLYANEMNCHWQLDPRLQYDYYFNSIRPNKRRPFVKWPKNAGPKEDENLGAVIEYYGFNVTKARQAMRILTPIQLETIKRALTKGGPA